MKKTTFVFSIIIILVFSNVSLAYQEIDWGEIIKKNKEQLKGNKNYKIEYELSVALANRGKIKRATKRFKSMGQLDNKKDKVNDLINAYKQSDTLLALNYLAFAYFINNDFKKAEKTFIKLIDNNPRKNNWNYNYLAVSQFELGKYNKARKQLEKSLEIKENDYTYFLLGANYYKLGNPFKSSYYLTKGRKGAKLFL